MSEPEHQEAPPTEPTTTEVHVEVTEPEPPEPTPATEPTTVVVADGGDTGIHPTLAAFMADQAAINERLLASHEHTASVADAAQTTAQDAAGAVEGAVGEVEAVGAEVAATVAEQQAANNTNGPETDQDPKNSVHPWYRKRGHKS